MNMEITRKLYVNKDTSVRLGSLLCFVSLVICLHQLFIEYRVVKKSVNEENRTGYVVT